MDRPAAPHVFTLLPPCALIFNWLCASERGPSPNGLAATTPDSNPAVEIGQTNPAFCCLLSRATCDAVGRCLRVSCQSVTHILPLRPILTLCHHF
ncbi:hypothetical protein N657DRAFT_88219 [Parathielavia appendiculata]|uniref:Secreted protein n=1 Tax=Parathielavia appendiculata TaxID=2587402 RepID=A0AAN6Z8F5_9PEZI|nr:hypothetical protein N657DRAFT_88219 [Parathielavia appendiculata]